MNHCISIIKNKNIICNRKCINNTFYCGLHKKYIKKKIDMKIIKKNKNKFNKLKNKLNNLYKKYIKIIDKYNYENLMSIYESFSEIPLEHLVFIDNKIWDITLLIDLWANSLCSTEMQNSSPVFPSNPFTRKNINLEDVRNIIFCLNCNKIKIYSPLKYLLLNFNRVLDKNDVNYNTDCKLKKKITNLLEEQFRFRLLNIKNSQDSYIGIWVDKYFTQSDFEVFFDYYDKLPIQTQNTYGEIIDNYEKIQIKNLLDNYPLDNYNINDYLDPI
jgi:hypothetical protein